MQITNNNTTIELNEAKIMAFITNPLIAELEDIIAKHHQCAFIKIPAGAFHTHLYLCRVMLSMSLETIADTYDMSISEIKTVTKVCHEKMNASQKYQDYLYKFYFQFNDSKN